MAYYIVWHGRSLISQVQKQFLQFERWTAIRFIREVDEKISFIIWRFLILRLGLRGTHTEVVTARERILGVLTTKSEIFTNGNVWKHDEGDFPHSNSWLHNVKELKKKLKFRVACIGRNGLGFCPVLAQSYTRQKVSWLKSSSESLSLAIFSW